MRKLLNITYAVVGLLLLQLVCLELHELAHHISGRLICGCWGKRDFFNWTLCSGCAQKPEATLATLAGPLVNIVLCWIAAILILSSESSKKTIGLFLLFANLPLVRWLAVADGGGDEFVAFKYYLGGYLSWFNLRAIAFFMESLLLLPPLFIAFRNMRGRWKPLWFVLLLMVPGLFIQGMQNGLNALLMRGVLSNNGIMQIPKLVSICFFLCLILLWVLRKKLRRSLQYLIIQKEIMREI